MTKQSGVARKSAGGGPGASGQMNAHTGIEIWVNLQTSPKSTEPERPLAVL